MGYFLPSAMAGWVFGEDDATCAIRGVAWSPADAAL